MTTEDPTDIWQYTVPAANEPTEHEHFVGINSWRSSHLGLVIRWLVGTYGEPDSESWYVYNSTGAHYIVMSKPVYTMYTLKYSDVNPFHS